MIFITRVAGIPCKCSVSTYIPELPPIVNQRPEDSDPGESSIFEFSLLDRKGRHAPWLEKKLSDTDVERLEEEYLIMLEAEYQLID